MREKIIQQREKAVCKSRVRDMSYIICVYIMSIPRENREESLRKPNQ